MDPRKAALNDFLGYARNALEKHSQDAVRAGKLPPEDARKSLATFDERKGLVLNAFDRQVGGAEIPSMPSMPKLPTGKFNMNKVPGPEEIEKQIDALVNFNPADHIAPAIQPILDKSLWMFIPEVRGSIKQIVGTFFLLGSIEELPIFGPLIASSMDVATAFMPALAATAQNMLPNIIGLAPIPYAAFVGEAAGYIFSSVMMFMTLMTQVSRGEFLEALESSAGLLPVIGTTLMTYVNKGKKIVEKAMEMKQKIVVSLAQIQGLVIFLLPKLTKKAGEILAKIVPILQNLIAKSLEILGPYAKDVLKNIEKAKTTALIYLLKPSNLFLEKVGPVLKQAKQRLNTIKREEAKEEALEDPTPPVGGRYTKRTLRKKRRNRKVRKSRRKLY